MPYLEANSYNTLQLSLPKRSPDEQEKTTSHPEKEDNETQETKRALKEIGQLVSNCNKYNCISHAIKLIAYLTHKSHLVRQAATDALGFIIRLAIAYAGTESNSFLGREISSNLQSILQELRDLFSNGYIKQDASTIHELLRNMEASGLTSNVNKYEVTGNENSAISEITKLFATCNKHNCVSHAKAVLKYLSHESKLVRELASEALIFFLTVAIEALEGSPSTKGELVKGLEEILTEIIKLTNTGLIPPSIVAKLKKIIKDVQLAILKEKIKELRRTNEDQFVCPELQKATKNLIGNMTTDEFVACSKQIKPVRKHHT